MKIVYILLIICTAPNFISGMKEEEIQTQEPTEYPASQGWLFDQPEIETKKISCKTNAGVSFEGLVLTQSKINIPFNQERGGSAYSVKETLPTPRKQKSNVIPAVDLACTKKTLYFLGEDKHKQKHIFSQKILSTKNITDEKKFPVNFFYHKKPYFFYQLSNSKQVNEILVSAEISGEVTYSIKHNQPIISFGTIQNTILSGSAWPSIKKSTLPPKGHTINTESFIDNAFLLACKDNGMIIAKVNEEDNAKFWFWRRFNKTEDVNVTLYALFFEPQSIATVNKKMIEKALDKAKKKYTAQNKIYSKNNITVITLASNVVFTADHQRDPGKLFPKAAIHNNTALVVHTQKYPDSDTDSFSIQNPAVSIAYKNEIKEWKIDQWHLNGWIFKRKQIATKYIRLPSLYEIKDIYITQHNNEPIALLISKVHEKYNISDANYADGVYIIPLTGQKENDLPEPFWHMDIEYTKKTSPNSKPIESWKPIEKIVASTFDYKNNRLFLITESIPKNPKDLKQVVNQQLITIDIAKAMEDLKLKELPKEELKELPKEELKEYQKFLKERKK